MALPLTPDQELIQSVVREFAQSQLAPEATAIDRESRFPRTHLEKFAPLGLLGMTLGTDQGGSGTDTVSFLVALEEVAKASGTDAALLILQNALVAPLLGSVASPAQRERLLPPLLAGTQVAAVALTEEAGGNNLGEPLTTAVATKDGFDLRGSKAYVALGGVADWYITLANEGKAGLSLFVVPSGADGLHTTTTESKLGLRGLPLTELYINRVQVDADARLGPPGGALAALEPLMDLARIAVGAGLVGLTQAALEQSIAFSRSRIQFGQPIASFGAIRSMLADVSAELESARATLHGAARLRDAGKPHRIEALEARLLAHRIAIKGTRIAHKIHGGAGFMRDLPLERVSRDVRTLMHLWDAQDILRSRLANELLGS